MTKKKTVRLTLYRYAGKFLFFRIKKRCKECDISYVILQRIMIEQLLAGKHSDEDFAWKIVNGRGPMPSY